jgi:hypothetical protein
MPPNTMSVARPGPWGNPYRVGDSGSPDAATAVGQFRAHLEANPSLVEKARQQLAGKNLACWCALSDPCHADVLLEIANPGD